VEVALMQPLDPERTPRPHIPQFNHVGLWIDDLPAAIASLTARGLRIEAVRKGPAGFDAVRLHPDSTEGALIELVQGPSEVELISRAARLAPRHTSAGDRGFQVLGLQQIAVGGLDKAALARLWVDAFRLEKLGTFRSEKENVDEDILRVGKGGHAVEVDLMQPIDPARAPKVHIPPLNHLGVWVDDVHAAVGLLTQRGVRFAPGGVRKGAAGHDVAFIHPKGSPEAPLSGEGVLIELVQAPAPS